jgi:hypothetical protein
MVFPPEWSVSCQNVPYGIKSKHFSGMVNTPKDVREPGLGQSSLLHESWNIQNERILLSGGGECPAAPAGGGSVPGQGHAPGGNPKKL